MSAQHYKGGHELDAPPTRQLFNIVWGLGAITLLSIITCVQLFNQQRDALLEERYAGPSARLAQYQDAQNKLRFENGETELNDNGKVVTLAHVPVTRAVEKVLADPKLLLAAPPPPGWMHPDGALPVPAPVPAPAPEGAPAEGAAGAEGATTSPEAAPAGDAKPAEAGAESGKTP